MWMPERDMTYVCRKMSEDRWLYVTENEKRIVGGITQEGFRRYRIQLALHNGNLLWHPVVFERFMVAQRILTSKLASCAAARCKGPVFTAEEGDGVIADLVGR
jgi:hypothetical protein